jgi:hypothetical protein
MNMMLGLPPGFVKNPYFGLGLNYDIIHLVHAIERLIGIKDLRICRQTKAGSPVVEGSSYVISTRLFDVARRTINRIHERALGIAQGEKHIFAHNAILTALDAVAYPEQNPPYRKGSISRAIGKGVGRETKLSWVDQELIVRLTRTAVDSLTREKPAEMLALSQEIEVVSLEGLIERLSQRFKKKLREAEWQTFFVENPFVLRLAFGLPVMMLGGQISVGGRRFGGSGDKISDFAVKAAASGNLALVEIKTPETPLLETSPYRGELYAPGRELSGAVNQVLEQRYNLQQNINNLKVASRLYDVETYAVQCLVVAGRTPASPATLKSLELFRNGLKSVTIVTFDELLAKLEQLLEFLKGTT